MTFTFNGVTGALVRTLNIPAADRQEEACTTTSSSARCGNLSNAQRPGDINKDGRGSTRRPTSTTDATSRCSRAPGDLNGDGEPDYVAGAPFQDVGADQDQGRLFFFLSHVAAPPPPPPPVAPPPGAPPPPPAPGSVPGFSGCPSMTVNVINGGRRRCASRARAGRDVDLAQQRTVRAAEDECLALVLVAAGGNRHELAATGEDVIGDRARDDVRARRRSGRGPHRCANRSAPAPAGRGCRARRGSARTARRRRRVCPG